MLQLSQNIDLPIVSLGSSGEGVGSLDGFKVFVDGALPNEFVRAKLSVLKPNYGKGSVVQILKPSNERIEPICKVFEQCGGCQLMHLRYGAQLLAKQAAVTNALERIGGFRGVQVEACCPSPSEFYYRNKIQLPVAGSSNQIRIGLYKKKTHELVEFQHCHIHTKYGHPIVRLAQQMLRKASIEPYCEKTKRGTLRHILARTSIHSGESVVLLVTTGRQQRLVKRFGETFFKSAREVCGVVQCINRRSDNVVLENSFQTLAGIPYIFEKLENLTFKVSPQSFFSGQCGSSRALVQPRARSCPNWEINQSFGFVLWHWHAIFVGCASRKTCSRN